MPLPAEQFYIDQGNKSESSKGPGTYRRVRDQVVPNDRQIKNRNAAATNVILTRSLIGRASKEFKRDPNSKKFVAKKYFVVPRDITKNSSDDDQYNEQSIKEDLAIMTHLSKHMGNNEVTESPKQSDINTFLNLKSEIVSDHGSGFLAKNNEQI